jgi:phage gp45-like
MKHLSTRYAAERVGNSISRTIVERVDDTKYMQQHALSGYAGEQQDQIEHVHPYGFVSVVQKPTGSGQLRMGAEGFMGFMGGGRSHGAVFIAGDRRYRLYKLADGEIAMHYDQGQQVHFKRDEIGRAHV